MHEPPSKKLHQLYNNVKACKILHKPVTNVKGEESTKKFNYTKTSVVDERHPEKSFKCQEIS